MPSTCELASADWFSLSRLTDDTITSIIVFKSHFGIDDNTVTASSQFSQTSQLPKDYIERFLCRLLFVTCNKAESMFRQQFNFGALPALRENPSATGQRRVTYELSSEDSSTSEAVTIATTSGNGFYQNLDSLQTDKLHGSLDKIRRTYVQNTKFSLDRKFVRYCQSYVRNTTSLSSTMTGQWSFKYVVTPIRVFRNHLIDQNKICKK